MRGRRLFALLLLLVVPITLGVDGNKGVPTVPDLTGVWSIRVRGMTRSVDGQRDYFREKNYLIIDQFDGSASMVLGGGLWLSAVVGQRYVVASSQGGGGPVDTAAKQGVVTVTLDARIGGADRNTLKGNITALDLYGLDADLTLLRFEANRLSEELPGY